MTVRKLIAVVVMLAAVVGAWVVPASAGMQPCDDPVDALCADEMENFCVVYVDVAPIRVICLDLPGY